MRELTFRPAKEGTGEPLDLDDLEAGYDQKFVWDRAAEQIVGGYRLARIDQILMRQGKEGLYTATLFDIDDSVLETLNPALELEGSLVVPDYQRSFAMLEAEFLGFNVNPDFSNVIDGLICVDLFKAPRRKLARFMGPVAVEALHAAQDFMILSRSLNFSS